MFQYMEPHDIVTLRKFIVQSKLGMKLDECYDIRPLICKYRLFHRYMKQYVEEYEEENKIYTYMLTFTIDPKKHDVKDSKLHDVIEEYIVGFAERRNPLKSDIVKEGTDEDHKHTHWHLGLELKKYIDFSTFLKHYRKKYGSVDISKSWSNVYNNILIYINKSNPSTKLA